MASNIYDALEKRSVWVTVKGEKRDWEVEHVVVEGSEFEKKERAMDAIHDIATRLQFKLEKQARKMIGRASATATQPVQGHTCQTKAQRDILAVLPDWARHSQTDLNRAEDASPAGLPAPFPEPQARESTQRVKGKIMKPLTATNGGEEEKLRSRGGFQAAFPLTQMNRHNNKHAGKTKKETKT